MKILLTRDQESTLWNFQKTIIVDGHSYLFSPYFLHHLGAGEYDRLSYDQLPEKVKDAILTNQGIKLPTE